MAFIIDENGNYIPVLGESSGGGGGGDVGDGKITINQGGTKKGEFTVNQAGDTTIDLEAGGSSLSETGSATQPIYINSSGVPTATTYSLEKSVPSDAVFTDTTYSAFTGADGTSAGASGLVPAPTATDNTKFLKGDGAWTAADATLSSTSTNPVQNKVITTALGNKQDVLTEGDRISIVNNTISATAPLNIIYFVTGQIAKSSSTDFNWKGQGVATVKLYNNGIAEIDYSYVVTENTSNSSNYSWNYGLSRDLLHSLNSNIPLITPVKGGKLIVFNNNGEIWTDRNNLSAYNVTNYGNWTISRIYDSGSGNYAEGAFGSDSFPVNTRVIGTAYGTYSVD
jgi:hypothetical protein